MVKHLKRTLKVLLLLFVVGVVALFLWLRQDVRSLERARPWIMDALNNPEAPYVVAFEEASIDWKNWAQFGLLQIKKVTVSQRDGTVFATLPAVYISIDPLGLITHRRAVNTVLLRKPKLFLTRDADRVVRLGVESDTAAIPVADIVHFFSGDEAADDALDLTASLPFRRLIIDRAEVTYTDAMTNSTLKSERATLRMGRGGDSIEGSLILPFVYNGVAGSIEASLNNVRLGDTHRLNALMHRVPLAFACVVTTCAKGMEAKGWIDGSVAMTLDDEAQPIEGKAQFAADHALITAPTIFAEPLEVARAQLQLAVSDAMRRVQLQRLELALADTTLEATGNGWREEAGWNVDVQARGLKPLDVTKLYKYWPLPLAPKSRTWVIGSMKAGRGDRMALRVKLTPADFAAPVLPDTAVDAYLLAQNATVEYLPGFPLMKNVNGDVHFTGTAITIDAHSGTSLTGTTLSRGSIVFPDLHKEGTPMEVELTLQAPAGDAATLLSLNHFTFDDGLALNPATITGTVTSDLKLKFNAFSQETDAPSHKPGTVDFSHVTYDITANLNDVGQEKLAGKIHATNINGAIIATNDGMHLDGNVMLGGATPIALKATQKSGEDVMLSVNGSVGAKQLVQLGVPDEGYIGEGAAKITAQLLVKKDTMVVEKAEADMTDLALAIPELSWNKNRGVAGTISIRSAENKGVTEYRIDTKADDLVIADAAITVDTHGNLTAIRAPRIQSKKNDFAASYRTNSDGYDVTLSGKKLDASAAYARSDNGLLKDFPPIHLTLDLAELVLEPSQPFANMKGFLSCNRQRCDAASFRAMAGRANLTASIQQKPDGRQLQLHASNAGDFLRALNFTDRVYGGALEIKGSYDDTKTPPLFTGRGIMTDFKLKNSAILGRILSIGSLTGLSNALTGDGIAFNKFSAEIGQQAGVIVVKDGKASGTAMGITTEGTIDTNAATMKLKGVVVPAYMLNSLLGKIPVIGVLAGGEGEGLIAFNYRVDGAYDDPDVSVNPLSGLTPGFLRGIFGAFDQKPEKK